MFSSGPTKKYASFNFDFFDKTILGRSHRSKKCKEKISQVIKLTKSVLEIPNDYKIIIITGSATSAVECAIWNLLGNNHVDVITIDVFSHQWAKDVENLNISHTKLNHFIHHPENDLLFTWNGTTSGICSPNGDWIEEKRQGITICDATSCAFCVELPWKKLDVTCFSWQKGLGSEGGNGMIVLSPRAIQRLQEYKPKWIIPKLFTLNPSVLNGEPINTPSMLVIEDYYHSLLWAQKWGLEGLVNKVNENFQVIREWVELRPWVEFLAKKNISKTSVCLVFKDKTKQIAEELEEKGLAYDILNHRDAPLSLRIWCGPTIEKKEIEELTAQIDKFFI